MENELNESVGVEFEPKQVERKCHCHEDYCPDCYNVCFVCSDTGIAGKSDRYQPEKSSASDWEVSKPTKEPSHLGDLRKRFLRQISRGTSN